MTSGTITHEATARPGKDDGSRDAAAAASYIENSLTLCSSRTPARRLPRMLATLMPNPCESIEAFRRFRMLDIQDMTWAAARHEALRLRFAIALVAELEDVPAWVFKRLRALDARTRSVAA
jgi:hypothetical protein